MSDETKDVNIILSRRGLFFVYRLVLIYCVSPTRNVKIERVGHECVHSQNGLTGSLFGRCGEET
jgi:hypothetical protein